MDCLEFRRLAGADPQHPTDGLRSHAQACPRCADYLRQCVDLDRRILEALRVPVPPVVQDRPALPAESRPAAAGHRGALARLDTRRWYAFAASILAGVLVGSLLWVGNPRNSLAEDVIAHLGHEPEALVVTTTPADARTLEAVLERGGIRLRPQAGLVSYANSCRFRGRTVPHLVVQSDTGPVTVLVLRNERPDAPLRFAEGGFAGTILPAGPGSIAVIGDDGADLEQVTARVLAAVDWIED